MISFISTFVLGPNADILNYRRRQFLVSYQNYAFSSFWCSAMPAFLTTLSELETVCKVQKSLYLYTYVNGICRLNKSYTSAIWVFMSTKWDVYDVPLNDDICCFSSLSRIFHSQGEVTIAGEGLQTLTYMYTKQHWAVRALSHATPTVTRGISF